VEQSHSGIEQFQLARLETGINGLDDILRGGLVRGGIYLISGPPGTGKTTLGNHIAYHHAREGGTVLFVTIMSETHERMLSHLSSFAFFDPTMVGNSVYYISTYDEVVSNGLSGVLEVLRRVARERRATMMVVDGAGIFEDFAETTIELRRFVQELHAFLSAFGCTVLLLSDYDEHRVRPIGPHVDGIVMLEDASAQLGDVRFLHVMKMRGVGFLRGRHQFAITSRGIEVYPVFEATFTTPAPAIPGPRRRMAFGVEGLDDMLRGGLLSTSTTIIMGAPGAGKTTAGLHFIREGARRGEKGLIVGFQETPAQLIGKATAVGQELQSLCDAGLVRILWFPPSGLPIDAWALRVRDEIQAFQPSRLFVDSLSDLHRIAVNRDRMRAFLTAFNDMLRSHAVTAIYAAETYSISRLEVDRQVAALLATVENTILFGYLELRSTLFRLISILKVGESDYDTSIREFRITESGITVSSTFESAEAVLSDASSHTAFDPNAATARASQGLVDR
jgi:circadian clock protein KaiC